jgi:hypothetical protein
MKTMGTILGPGYDPYQVETESSGQECVRLDSKGQSVEFISIAKANTMVIRFSLPDSQQGNGSGSTIGIYKNGHLLRYQHISSYYSWLYGKYPFSNDPAAGKPRHFYDEVRLRGMDIEKGDAIRIERDDGQGDNASYCILDLVDLENIAPALIAPGNSLSITDKAFQDKNFNGDYTDAFRNCIAKASETGKIVWIPPGSYKITGDIILPANITIRGAGMWYSELVGDQAAYTNVNNRVRLKGSGGNIHLADFAITGKLNYRSDRERNDGIVGSFGIGSTISRIWIEHTKVGMWIENSRDLKITGCRMRNTIADGINFCVGMNNSVVQNCTARGTGDDCFAIWPTTSLKQQFSPGHNLIIHCTAQLPFLANGAAVYGGDSNEIRDCSFTDISQGSAILISTTFPTENSDKTIDNNFSGRTVIDSCSIATSGGFDHEWGWRGALEICVDKRSISGLTISNVTIKRSLSNGLRVVAKNEDGKIGELVNTVLENVTIFDYGLGEKGKYGLFIAPGAHGGMLIKRSDISDTMNESGDFKIIR